MDTTCKRDRCIRVSEVVQPNRRQPCAAQQRPELLADERPSVHRLAHLGGEHEVTVHPRGTRRQPLLELRGPMAAERRSNARLDVDDAPTAGGLDLHHGQTVRRGLKRCDDAHAARS